MNIILADFEPWDSGLTNYAIAVTEGLMKRKHNVIFAGIKGKIPIKLAAEKGIQSIEMKNCLDIFTLLKTIKRFDIQVLNAHDGKSHFLCFLIKFLKFRKIRLIRTYSDAKPVKRHRIIWNYTDKFIAVAEFIKNDFLKQGLRRQDIEVIYQGIKIDDSFTPENKEVNKSKDFNITIVGRLDPVKGHKYFLEAAAIVSQKIPGTGFTIIGAEKNVKIRELKLYAGSMHLKKVKFLGYVEDINFYMRTSDIGVIASTGSEAISRTALEWMSNGIPIIVTNVGCLPEIIEHGKTGLIVPPADADSLAKAICKLLLDTKLRQEMARAGLNRIKEKFSQKNFIDETEKIFKRVI